MPSSLQPLNSGLGLSVFNKDTKETTHMVYFISFVCCCFGFCCFISALVWGVYCLLFFPIIDIITLGNILIKIMDIQKYIYASSTSVISAEFHVIQLFVTVMGILFGLCSTVVLHFLLTVYANRSAFLLYLLFLAVKMPSKSISTFKIPEIHFPLIFQCVHSYYTDFFNHLSKAINTLPPDNSALLARYFYLRGLISLMQGKLLNALSDFQNLDKTDLRIFPTDLVRKIVETMPPSERLQADRKPELKKLISRVMEKQREVLKIDDHVKNFELPKTHMQLEDFVKRIQESGIVRDIDTIHRLFDALTVGGYTACFKPPSALCNRNCKLFSFNEQK